MDFRKKAEELVAQMTLDEKISQMLYNAPAIPRLHVPAYNWWNECLHGVGRAGNATVFPQAIAMAASFDAPLMHRVACAISDEARAKYNEYRKFGDTLIYQGLTYWSPNINIFRDPRWGRGPETYGEDPCLTGRMGTAFVRGLQGDGPYRKLDATLKHYCVHSGPEGSRHSFDARVSTEELYDTYLAAFRYCIENADPSAVMGAYNRVEGEPCCGSRWLLQDVLRDELGFTGYVVSDCGAIKDFYTGHMVTEDAESAAAMAVNAGCDLNCGGVYAALGNAVASGLVSEETVTEAVTRLFTARYRLGMFADDCPYDSIPYDVVECPAHTALNRQMAQSGIVLLKNNGILPLSRKANIAVIGPNAQNTDILLGNYNGTPTTSTTLLQGILNAAQGKVLYAEGCHKYEEERPETVTYHRLRNALIAARHSDVVVMLMGIDPNLEGEEGERGKTPLSDHGDKVSIALPKVQNDLFHEIRKTGKPIVFVNVSGSAVALCDQKAEADALLQVFYPGATGGDALADILFGAVSPSGRLPVTFYRSDEDLPPFEDYSMENRTYRFFKGEPLYRFGHGLTYADVTETWDGAVCTVENRGGMDTAYTVLRYETPEKRRLIDFVKVYVRVGERVTVDFSKREAFR